MPKPTAPIFGFIGTIQITARLDFDEPGEDFLYGYARERHLGLEQGIQESVTETLGPDYEVLRVHLTPGSVHIMVALGIASMIYVTVSQYNDFINSINRLTRQLKRLTEAFFESATPRPPEIEISTTGSWEPSPSVIEAHRQLTANPHFDINRLLLYYLITSHAALLSVLIWLVACHFN